MIRIERNYKGKVCLVVIELFGGWLAVEARHKGSRAIEFTVWRFTVECIFTRCTTPQARRETKRMMGEVFDESKPGNGVNDGLPC